MASSMEEQFKDIFHPPKAAEEAINVDLAEKLENYLQTYVRGSTDAQTNFNSAALLIQGSSTVYSKKVEYLYTLASNLHDTLTKYEQKDDHKKKEKVFRQSKTMDPFCSTEIVVGKNLSCLRKRNAPIETATNKSAKKVAEKRHAFVPVDLLPLEGEEKGDPFYDTCGELIGYRNDYTLNKCNITTSGWLLLPTISPENITEDPCSSSTSIEDTPSDEGYPASSGCPSAPSSQAVLLSQPASSQQSDEGIGSMASTPSDGALSQPSEGGPSQTDGSSQESPMEYDDGCAAPDVDMENIPVDDFPTDEMAVGSKPPKPLTRLALQQMQLQLAEQKQKPNGDDLVSVTRPIEKNNCCLRSQKAHPSICPASLYCTRTFYSDTKLRKKDAFSLENKAFANNTKFLNKIKSFKTAIKAAKAKMKGGDAATDDEEDGEETDDAEEEAAVKDEHSFAANPGLTNDDFDEDPIGEEENPMAKENPDGEASKDNLNASFEFHRDDSERVTEEQIALFSDDLQTVEQAVEMKKRVRNWQKNLKPFLEEIDKRDKFDINLYGSQILNTFDESNRRQTFLFRKFCKDMEKYEIHRYFLALLPLANVGNVSIANEVSDEGEDIAITLLSRRMHHMELEEFGHNEGEHD